MNTLIEEMTRTWSDPHARHALLVHAPIVLAALGILPLLLLALGGFKSSALKVMIVLWFGAASGGSWLAAQAGEDAEHALEKRPPALTAVEDAAVHRHEELGEQAWIWPLIPAGLALLTLGGPRKMQFAAGVLAILASTGVAFQFARIGHTGGRIVYLYGVGVPARGAPAEGTELKAIAPPPQPESKPADQPATPPQTQPETKPAPETAPPANPPETKPQTPPETTPAAPPP
ncbi:MAG: hypothetical protein ACKVU4_13650 [Phycisphaerales bacterium]